MRTRSVRTEPLRAVAALILSAGVAVLVAACATQASPGDAARAGEAGEAPSTLPIAIDLVSVLVQLGGHSPYDTTVQANAPDGAFGERLLEALAAAGYGIQTVSADQGRNYLAHQSTSEFTESGRSDVFEMRLGALSISRRMGIEGGRYVPLSPVEIRGAPPEPVALAGSVYVARPDRPLRYPSGVVFLDTEGGTAASATFDYAYYPTGEARAASAPTAPDPARFLGQATGRLYARDADARAIGLRDDADFAASKVLDLGFPSASTDLLGPGNRNALETLVAFFDPDADRVRIVSCTPDRARDDASAARSARVKSELLTLGLPGARIVEADCPADTPRSVARRGLRVTLERLIGVP